jgi:peptide/nickel transport system permease protein
VTGVAYQAERAPARKRRRFRSGPVVAVCLVFVLAVIVMAIFGSLITPHNPNTQDLAHTLEHPSSDHWLGTDLLGRDVLSRLIVGASLALMGPFVVAVSSMILGSILGLWAGYRGGMVEGSIMRWVDLMWAVPGLLVIIVVSGAFGGGYWMAVGLLIVFTTPFDTRVVRGATVEQMPRPYVEAARALGVSDRRIMFFHIWPNISSIVVANSFLIFASTLVALSGLSFLGVGSKPGTSDWGLMLAEHRSLVFNNPVTAVAPGVMIALLATAINLIGDWVHERLSSRGATR